MVSVVTKLTSRKRFLVFLFVIERKNFLLCFLAEFNEIHFVNWEFSFVCWVMMIFFFFSVMNEGYGRGFALVIDKFKVLRRRLILKS